ncbi:MAG: secretin and TonB N-terminal domain-containing protein, partial [Candidatus Omnitrophota bacterium]
MKVKIFSIILIGAFMCNINLLAFAQEEDVMMPPDAMEAEAETILYEDEGMVEENIVYDETYDGEGAVDEERASNVTLIFKDADIRTVLHTLSYKSGINIVAASDVEGKVNIRLVDVPWQTALEVIVKNQGLSYEKIGNIIRVVTL